MKVLAQAQNFDISRGDNDKRFSHSLIVVGDDNLVVKLRISHRIPVDTDIQASCISRADCLPKYTEGTWSVAPLRQTDEMYIKTPNVLGMSPENKDQMLREAEFYEALKNSPPHPNIVEYKGVVQAGGLITGLCLKRYKQTLFERVERKEPLCIEDCIEGIRSGMGHLHSLGLCHNDINPSNIMFGDDDIPVIIDFDSADYIGRKLRFKGGTPGWRQSNAEISSPENDYFGLRKIREFLEDGSYK